MQTITGPKQVEKSPTLEPGQKENTTETLRVVTRAQAKKAQENGEKLNESETLPKDLGKQQARDENAEQVDQTLTSKDTNSGGSVLVDKVNETLETILKAYEKRLTTDTTIPPKLKEYPSPIQEKVNLVQNHALIRDTQTMLEGPPSFSTQRHPCWKDLCLFLNWKQFQKHRNENWRVTWERRNQLSQNRHYTIFSGRKS